VINPFDSELDPENMEKAFEEEGLEINSSQFSDIPSKRCENKNISIFGRKRIR
jgi:hypothetical protein